MIAKLVTTLQAALAGMPVATRHPWAQLIGGRPYVHVEGDEWKPITDDTTGSWSYWRMNGNVRMERVQGKGIACGGVRVTVPLRYVAMIERKACGDLDGLLLEQAAAIRSAKGAAQAATGMRMVQAQSIAWGTDSLAEVKDPPLQWALVHMDITVVAEGREECLNNCNT